VDGFAVHALIRTGQSAENMSEARMSMRRMNAWTAAMPS
jgi:hypothetical protein